MKHLLAVVLLVPLAVWAQNEKSPKLTVGGYVKDLATVNAAGKDSLLFDNLVHHRLNISWFPWESLTGNLELRNRLFFGDMVSTVPGYGEYIDVNNDYFDLSWTPVDNENVILHTMIDRAYVRWNKRDWEVTIGRQRINWGMNLAWNPNDIFNSYSFFDFDYEERPGSDALRIRKYTGFASEMEFAIKMADSFENLTSAVKYQINKWNYDIQLVGGVMKNNLALGAGWAGSIKSAGFKGEMTFLNHLEKEGSGFLSSVSVDYSFSSSLYLNGSVLYNSYGQHEPQFFLINSYSNLDIRSLSPYKWSAFVQGSYPVHPLVNIGLANIYFPSDASLYLNPSVSVSLLSNLDLDLIGQLFFTGNQQDNYGASAKIFYLRVKWSY